MGHSGSNLKHDFRDPGSRAPLHWQPLHGGSDSRLGHPCCYLRGACKFPDLGSGVAFAGY